MMGPDDDSLLERGCTCTVDCTDCPGDDGLGENCGGCGHLRSETETTEAPVRDAPSDFMLRAIGSPVNVGSSWRHDWGNPYAALAPARRTVPVDDRVKAVEAAAKALRTQRSMGSSEPGLVDEIIRLANYILGNEVDDALRG